MSGPKRLFDCLSLSLSTAPEKVMLSGKENGTYREYRPAEIKEITDKLACALLEMGYGPDDGSPEGKDKIALVAKNRPEWIFLDLAVQRIGAVLVPIYPTIGESELKYILSDSQARIIFINDDSYLEKLSHVLNDLPRLKTIYSIDPSDKIPSWTSLLKTVSEDNLKNLNSREDTIRNEDLATIIYTSGTTGTPKGVMLSHNNLLSNVLDSIECFPPGENLRALSFLPLNHVFERMIIYLYLFKGVSVYFAESLDKIVDNLKEVKPHVFTTVPRLLEKVYEKIMETGNQLAGIKRKIFFWANSIGKLYEVNKNQGWWYNFQLNWANKLVFNKWREALGGEIICIVSGGAACPVYLVKIFTAARLVIMEGYGLTETSPVISVNRYEKENRMPGTVGPLIRNVEVKIADDGEILCKGPNIMMGYYKKPEETAEVMDGEWFRTGDIGTMVDGKFLKITDRKKEIFKTSGGKYVAPLAVESRMNQSRFIEHTIVLGPGRKFVTALIAPSFENLEKWVVKNGIQEKDKKKLLKDKNVIQLFRSEIDRLNVGINHVEQVKKFELLPDEWSIATGEMTPKLSLRRKVIIEKYKDVIESMYTGS